MNQLLWILQRHMLLQLVNKKQKGDVFLMANIDKNGAFMALPMNIKRGNPIPVDTTMVWYSMTDLQE